MGKRKDRWAPPLLGPGTNPGPSMTVMVSDDEKAGRPLPPLVEVRPHSPPLQISEAGELPPEPPPPPFDRGAALTALQHAFAKLDDLELQVAQMRIVGFPIWDIGEELGLEDEAVERIWKGARSKLGRAIFGGG